jgi:hypothetical protein
MKRFLTCALLLAAIGFGYAQDSSSQSGGEGFAPSAGDFTGAILFGRANYQTSGFYIPNSPGTNTSWTIYGSRPVLNTVGTTNDVSNMIGGEARYFVTNRIAAKLSGGAIISNTPSFTNTVGVIDPDAPNSAWIPNYAAVEGRNEVDANINIGGEYQFSVQSPRLLPYVGINFPFYYGRRSAYDPTVIYSDSDPEPVFYDIGWRHSEMWGMGIQAVGGVDYYIAEGMYLGFEIKPISWVYSGVANYPAPGLESWRAETNTWGFFVQPFLKFGFRF